MTVIKEYTIAQARKLGLIEDFPAEANLCTKPRPTTPQQGSSSEQAMCQTKPKSGTPAPVTQWGDLSAFRSIAESLTDAKKARVSAKNRVERGNTADSLIGQAIVNAAEQQEEMFKAMLLDEYSRQVPDHVREWARSIPGFGDGVLFARVIGVLGHPRLATPYAWDDKHQNLVPGEPFERSISQLWQYAGCGDPMSNPRSDILGHSPTGEDKLRGGKRTVLRPLLYTFSSYLQRSSRHESITNSKYFQVLTEAKADAASKVHTRQCQNKKRPPMGSNGCGTVQHPEWGEPGSPWRAGHQQAHSHRIVAKEFLRDLWLISE